MKATLTQLLLFSLISFHSYSTKYYTLMNGNWNNSTIVWSKNGITPCMCKPDISGTVTSDTIIINHTINLSYHLDFKSSGLLQVNTSGKIVSTNYDLTLNNSKMFGYGPISVKKLTVSVGSLVHIYKTTLIMNNGLDLFGSFTGDLSNIYSTGGNVEVNSSGTFVLTNGSRLQLDVGNFGNFGTTNICAACCIYLNSGNVKNENTGIFSGSGAVISNIGTIKNYNVWSSSIRWCANGADQGMTSPENCTQANDICKFVPLPTQLISFTGINGKDQNILFWETASESESDYFDIEKSSDGIDWEIIGTVYANGSSNNLSHYEYIDENEINGLRYYKLTQINKDGETNFSKMLSLTNQLENELWIYPNPTNQSITVQLSKENTFNTLKIFDPTGRKIKEIEIGDTFSINLQLPIQNGVYFIQAEGEGITKTYTIVKI